MKYALSLEEDGRILSVTYEKYASEGMPIVDERPEGNVTDYLFLNDQYIYDPQTKPEKPEPGATLEDRVTDLETDSSEMKEALEMILSGVTE